MANDYEALASGLNKVSSILFLNPDKLIPFDRLTLSNELSDPTKKTPSLDMTISGLPSILGVAALPHTLEDVVINLAKLNFAGIISDLSDLAGNVASFASQQISVGLSLLLVLQNAVDPVKQKTIATSVENAYGDYFFGDKGGFVTLEGATISPPTVSADNSSPVTTSELRAFFSQKTADQFIRKLLQVTGESTGDAIFNLRTRYPKLTSRPDSSKELRWFSGMATLAESTVTSAVEEALLGAATFTTNPLFAASLGTFAGTAARKATQHAFLEVIGIPYP
jgi:hypothetical protein